MEKVSIEIPASEVCNLEMVVKKETNLVLVPVRYINRNKWNLEVDDKIDVEINWQQFGYGCAIPNSYGVLKMKRRIPSPKKTGVTIDFDENDFSSYGLKSVFERKNVVLATMYFVGSDVPKEHRTSREVIEKIESLKAGDNISIRKKDGGSLTASVLSLLRADNCEEMFTKKVGRIPFDYSSLVLELSHVEVD